MGSACTILDTLVGHHRGTFTYRAFTHMITTSSSSVSLRRLYQTCLEISCPHIFPLVLIHILLLRNIVMVVYRNKSSLATSPSFPLSESELVPRALHQTAESESDLNRGLARYLPAHQSRLRNEMMVDKSQATPRLPTWPRRHRLSVPPYVHIHSAIRVSVPRALGSKEEKRPRRRIRFKGLARRVC